MKSILISTCSLCLALLLLAFSPTEPGSVEDMVLVEGGTIELGDTVMQVPSFYIDRHEVTLRQFKEFIDATGYVTYPERHDGCLFWKNGDWVKSKDKNWRHDGRGEEIPLQKYAEWPVSNITYIDAMAYAEWCGKSLPKVSQWLFAAKGGNSSEGYIYSGSNNWRKVAWTTDNAGDERQAIMTKRPNELGIYDMSGNISELVVSDTSEQIFSRGGYFFSVEDWCALDNDGWEYETIQSFHTTGFRCVKNID